MPTRLPEKRSYRNISARDVFPEQSIPDRQMIAGRERSNFRFLNLITEIKTDC